MWIICLAWVTKSRDFVRNSAIAHGFNRGVWLGKHFFRHGIVPVLPPTVETVGYDVIKKQSKDKVGRFLFDFQEDKKTQSRVPKSFGDCAVAFRLVESLRGTMQSHLVYPLQ
jgi:hypothetical protein